MSRAALSREYRQLLAAEGLSLAACDAGHHLEVLRFTEAMRLRRVPDAPKRDDEELARLADALALAGGTWNYRIQSLLPGVLGAAHQVSAKFEASASLTLPSEESVFFGEFPTLDANARANRVDAGYLVLVNAGLCECLGHFAPVLTEARAGAREPASMEQRLATATQFASAIARKYLGGRGQPSTFVVIEGGAKLSQPTSIDMGINSWVVEASLAFVVCHEVAHIMLHHCDNAPASLVLVDGRPTYDNPRWQQEVSADSLGTLILEQWCAAKALEWELDDAAADAWIAHALFAPYFFHAYEKIVLATVASEADVFNITTGTHPPPSARQWHSLQLLRARSESHRHFLRRMAPYRRFLERIADRLSATRITGMDDAGVSMTRGSAEDLQKWVLEKARELGRSDIDSGASKDRG